MSGYGYPPPGHDQPYPPPGHGSPFSPPGHGTPFSPPGHGQPYHPSGHSYPYPPHAGLGNNPFSTLVPSAFPPGTDPNVVAAYHVVDEDGSGLIDDNELRTALSSFNQTFSLRTVRLLMYLFTRSNARQIGPTEFTSVYYNLQSWKLIFERFDRDNSGMIDGHELREALMSLGYAVSPYVLELLISKYDRTRGYARSIAYDNFIECCLTVKGLTEKFKERDRELNGVAAFRYDDFMLSVLPFLIS